jgi:hypothetical protein
VRAGLASEIRPKGSAPDRYDIVAKKLDLFRRAHFPSRLYPDTTFESAIIEAYGSVAFDIAYVLDDGVRDAEAIDYYRLSIRLAPKSPFAYKNLGLLLFNRGAGPDDVMPLWEEFLRLAPDDEQAPAVRQRLAQWKTN